MQPRWARELRERGVPVEDLVTTTEEEIASDEEATEEAAEEAKPAYLVEWKGEEYDLRGASEFRFWQTEARDNPNRRILHAHLTTGSSIGVAIPCDGADECRAFQALCGPYFGTLHPGTEGPAVHPLAGGGRT